MGIVGNSLAVEVSRWFGYFSPNAVSHMLLAARVSSFELRLPGTRVSLLATAPFRSPRRGLQPTIDLFFVRENGTFVTTKMMDWQSVAVMPTLHCPQAPAQEHGNALPRIETLIVHICTGLHELLQLK